MEINKYYRVQYDHRWLIFVYDGEHDGQHGFRAPAHSRIAVLIDPAEIEARVREVEPEIAAEIDQLLVEDHDLYWGRVDNPEDRNLYQRRLDISQRLLTLYGARG